MNHFGTSTAGRVIAAIASMATTLTLLWAVVSLSEPERSQFVAVVAGRQVVNQRDAVLAKAGQTPPAADQPSRPAKSREFAAFLHISVQLD